MVSKIVSGHPVALQVAHTDFYPMVCQRAKSKPFITIAPSCLEGSMLLVWTKDFSQKTISHTTLIFLFTFLSETLFSYPEILFMPGFFALVDNQVMLTIATNTFISTFAMEMGIHQMQSLYAMLSTTEISFAMA